MLNNCETQINVNSSTITYDLVINARLDKRINN
jgi:hypothetical protein